MAPLTAAVLAKMPSTLVQSMACAWAPAAVDMIIPQALRSLRARMVMVLCDPGTNADMLSFGLKTAGLKGPAEPTRITGCKFVDIDNPLFLGSQEMVADVG